MALFSKVVEVNTLFFSEAIAKRPEYSGLFYLRTVGSSNYSKQVLKLIMGSGNTIIVLTTVLFIKEGT